MGLDEGSVGECQCAFGSGLGLGKLIFLQRLFGALQMNFRLQPSVAGSLGIGITYLGLVYGMLGGLLSVWLRRYVGVLFRPRAVTSCQQQE